MGLSILADWPMISAARHFLTTGAISLAIFLIMVFAGQVHSGRKLELSPCILVGIIALVIATILRVLMSVPYFSQLSAVFLAVSASLWVVAFVLYFICFWKALTGSAVDGRTGCL
jgi:uncharacterized protein involved in response to NO